MRKRSLHNENSLSMCEDWLGFLDRSSASKKGWETRKKNGWNPAVGMKGRGQISQVKKYLDMVKQKETISTPDKSTVSLGSNGAGGSSGKRDSVAIIEEQKGKPVLEQISAIRDEYERTKNPEAKLALMSYMAHDWEG